ncbi:MAG: AAA family ATPase, partial [Kiloniellales bacterium]
MRLKSFTAKTLPEAMTRVRDAFGPDAVILSTQAKEDGKGVRVTAALEDRPLDAFDFEPSVDGVQSIDEISEALKYHRVPPGLFDRLIGNAAALPSGDWTMALAGAIDAEFAFRPLPHGPEGRPLMLVGPPGAGKTATAAKLCARARLAGAKTSLITMDTVKAGSLAQVGAFARALNARLDQADDPEALAAAVAACPEDHLVVIDTLGVNPFDDDDLDHMSRAARAAEAAPVLVLPAGGDSAETAETAVALARVGAERMVATRLDAARRLG